MTLPLFHSTAQTCQMNSGLYGGFRLVLLPRFDPAQVLETIVDEERRILDRRADDVLVAARSRGIGGSRCRGDRAAPCASASQAARRCRSTCCAASRATFGVRVLEGYGLSETAPVVAFNQLHRPSKPGTVGFPIFGVDVRCVDEDGPAGRGRASAAKSSSAGRAS